MDATKDKAVDDCIWTPKILMEITESVELFRRQTIANFNLKQLDAAKLRGITFGIDQPPVDLIEQINILIGLPCAKKPKFYAASEMAYARTHLSKILTDVNNEANRHSKKKTPLCVSSESRTILLHNRIRLALSKHYMTELEMKMETAKSLNAMNEEIEKSFKEFINEIKKNDNHILLGDDVLETPPKAITDLPPVKLASQPSNKQRKTTTDEKENDPFTSISIEELRGILSREGGLAGPSSQR